jgi:hypothetical protein
VRFKPTMRRKIQMSKSGNQSIYLGRIYAVIEPTVIPERMLIVTDIVVGAQLLLQLGFEGGENGANSTFR